MDILENINPNVYQKVSDRNTTANEEDDNVADEIDTREIFGKHVGNSKLWLTSYTSLL